MRFFLFLLTIFIASCTNQEPYNESLLIKSANKEAQAAKYYEKGVSEARIHNYEKALSFFLKADSVHPNYTKTIRAIALTHKRLGECKSAITYYEKILKIDAFEYRTYGDIGICYLSLKQPLKAIQNFEKLMQLSPKEYTAAFALGETYLKMGNYNLGKVNLLKFKHIISNLNFNLITDQERLKIKKLNERVDAYLNELKKIENWKNINQS